VKAITATDAAVGTVYAACQRAGYVLLVTADHGNAEQMRNAETGAPHTAHTCNPVPFILAGVDKDKAKQKYSLKPDEDLAGEEEQGALADVAPTVLDIMVRRVTTPSLLFFFMRRGADGIYLSTFVGHPPA
jgi:2,3-bisphosphoglycerate-independent phosphoglycerate mutase